MGEGEGYWGVGENEERFEGVDVYQSICLYMADVQTGYIVAVLRSSSKLCLYYSRLLDRSPDMTCLLADLANARWSCVWIALEVFTLSVFFIL